MPGIEEMRRRFAADPKYYSPESLSRSLSDDIHFGPIANVPVGSIFKSRKDLAASGVHRANVAGIAGTMEGATSVVLSGQYEDDVDDGDVVLYTGTGGRHDDVATGWSVSGPQIKDQSFQHRHNHKLLVTYQTGRSIRLVRAVEEGYRYDGMYRITDAFMTKGKSGYAICRFKFQREVGQLPLGPPPTSSATSRTATRSRMRSG